MDKSEVILHRLGSRGHRLTRTRRAFVRLLADTDTPLSAQEVLDRLSSQGVRLNRTTVYRELAFLKKHRIIHEIQFGDGKMRYRVCPDEHHHHLICVRCSRVEDVIAEGDLEEKERELARSRSFRVLYHTLEFFGVCDGCDDGGAAGEGV